MELIPFVAGSYDLDTRQSGVQRTINMVPVPEEPGNERTAWVFKDAAGLDAFSVAPVIVPLFYAAPRLGDAAALSDGGLTVTYIDPIPRHAPAGVNRSIVSGKWYWEDTVNVTASSFSPFMGGVMPESVWDTEIANPPIGATLPLGNGGSICIRGNGTVQVQFSLYTGVTAAFSPGDICRVAYDADEGKLWYQRNEDGWCYSGDPVTGTNPASLTVDLTAGGPQVITVSAGVNGILGSVTSNFGATPFAFSPPAGFLPAVMCP